MLMASATMGAGAHSAPAAKCAFPTVWRKKASAEIVDDHVDGSVHGRLQCRGCDVFVSVRYSPALTRKGPPSRRSWLSVFGVSPNKTQVISTTCDVVFSRHGSMLMCSAAGLRRMMIMKKLLTLSVFLLTIFASVSGPAIASDIRAERGAPGWDGPQDPSPPWAPPG